MNNSKGFKMKSAYGSGLKQTGKMEAVGSMARRAQYDKLGWAYDETIPVQGPLKGREARPTTRSSNAGFPVVNVPAKKAAVKKQAPMEKLAAKGPATVKTATKEAKPKTSATPQKASTPAQKALVKQFTPKKEVRKEKRTVKKVARKSAKSTKKVSRLEGKLEAAKKAKK
jgi:hypothetical protein